MCDYSLHHIASRPARIEDKLVTTKFKNSNHPRLRCRRGTKRGGLPVAPHRNCV